MAFKIKFILNPIAGRGRNGARMKRILASVLDKFPCEYHIQQTVGRGDALRTAREAIREGFDVVAAVGGDGTVNEVASALVNSDACLGIIPIGSGNGLARGLGIPLQLKKACQILCQGKFRRIDVGKIQGRYFFATAGVGFGAVVTKRLNTRSRRGLLPHFYVGLQEFFNYSPKKIALRFDHRQITVKALLVAVANTIQFGNGAIIAPQAQPDDGLLDICIINDLNILQAIYHLPKLFTGHIDRTRYFEIYRSSNVEIILPGPAPIQVDGEALDGDARLKVSLVPKALKVMVPK
ncbi:diacylglycerol kinase family lipid kinase [candidate division KSB1 bacterium]|nr:diacylglycerol kinase family lipid kinase [candidate division KSB1 bacterium]